MKSAPTKSLANKNIVRSDSLLVVLGNLRMRMADTESESDRAVCRSEPIALLAMLVSVSKGFALFVGDNACDGIRRELWLWPLFIMKASAAIA